MSDTPSGTSVDSGDAGERAAVRTATISAALVVAAFVAGKAARDATLLRSFAIEWIPVFSGVAALLSLPLVLGAGRLLAQRGPTRVLPWLNAISAAMLVGEWLLLPYLPRITAVIVYLHLGSLGAVLVSGFWSVVNERFDVISAKVHIGRIGGGATLGGIAGGAIAERTAVWLPQGSILLVLAGLQLLCVALGRKRLRPTQTREEPAPPTPWAALRVVREIAMLRWLSVLVVAGALGAAALDYVFKAEVKTFTQADPLRVFAVYQMGTSIVTSMIQLMFVERVLARISPARTIGLLPLTLAGASFTSFLIPGLGATMVARGSENVVRTSLYRTSYELLFAPLPDADKRSSKILLDVGAERVGDLLGAQVVTLAVHTFAGTRGDILLIAAIAGTIGLAAALMIPRAYTSALERSLEAHTADVEPSTSAADLWTSHSLPALSESGVDQTAYSLLNLRAQRRRREQIAPKAAAPHAAKPLVVARPPDPVRTAIDVMRSHDVARIREILAQPLPRELVPHVISLVAWDTVAPEAVVALSAAAPRCTGTLVDALLDPETDFTIRRRLPAALVNGDATLAAVGLTRGLDSERFEVRYRCGKALRQLRDKDQAIAMAEAELYKRILDELAADVDRIEAYRLLDPDEDFGARTSTVVAHVFNLLTITLSPQAVQIAFASLRGDDVALRATAREYLDSALPQEVFARLWEVIEGLHAAVPETSASVA